MEAPTRAPAPATRPARPDRRVGRSAGVDVQGVRAAIRALVAGAALAVLVGCSAPGLVLTAAGVATDTSVTWEIVKHVHGRLTEGDPVPCVRLDGVERALNPGCGPYVAGTIGKSGAIGTGEPARGRVQGCVLAVALRDPRVWPALPDLLARGARSTDCETPPWVALAAGPGCPDFTTAPPEVRAALRTLAESDPRNRRHDVVRLLSCPAAVDAGLDAVLAGWLARGELDPDRIGFGALGALHPAYLGTPLAAELERRGHTAADGLVSHDGVQPGGFELALRTARWDALEWWIARVPGVAARVPAARADQLPWVPLARVLTPNFMGDPAQQGPMLVFLLARGADPNAKLPHDAGQTVARYARAVHSPHVDLLDPPPPAARLATAGE